MPKPRAANTAKAWGAGQVTASPMDAPMNGAVHGEATATASTPVKAESHRGWRNLMLAQEEGNTEPHSNTPARFRPIKVNSAASPATTVGDCN